MLFILIFLILFIFIAFCAFSCGTYVKLARRYSKDNVRFGILGIGIFLLSYAFTGSLAFLVIVLQGDHALDSLLIVLLFFVGSMFIGARLAWFIGKQIGRSLQRKQDTGKAKITDGNNFS